MRSPRLWAVAALVVFAASSRAASFDARIEALFRPPLGEHIALSPDGRRIAYTAEAGGGRAIVIVPLDEPGRKLTVKIEPDRDAASAADRPPVHLRFLRWASGSRLVFAPAERVVPLPPLKDKQGRVVPNPDGPTILAPIMIVDIDGKQQGTLVDARDFMETPEDAWRTLADLLLTPLELAASRKEPVRWRMPHLDILGFVPGGQEQLVIQTRGAYKPPTQHVIDVRSGNVSLFGGNWPSPPAEPQVFDWSRLKVVGERRDAAWPATTWHDPQLAGVQRELDRKFPRRAVEILDWNYTRARVLFRVTGGSDPGRLFVWQHPENLPLEILRVAPWLSATRLNETRFFDLAAADGARLSGYLTWPRNPRATPPPLLVVFPSGFPGYAQPAFDPEAQVFADLGFAVLRLNHRSVAGFKPGDLAVLRTAVDRVAVDDARAVMERIATDNPVRRFDRDRVAVLGRGFGGYLAVRALQLAPAVFRSGIAIDAPMDLRTWLQAQSAGDRSGPVKARPAVAPGLIDHAGADWQKLSVLEQSEVLTSPVLILVERGRSATVDGSTAELRTRLERLGRPPEHIELEPGFAAAQPESRAAVYRRIQDFMHRSLGGGVAPAVEPKEVE